MIITKIEAQINLSQTNYFSISNSQYKNNYLKISDLSINYFNKYNLQQHKGIYPKKNNSLLETNIENWFHIGIGASAFTYFLWATDKKNKSWIDTEHAPYVGFSYMPEVTIQLGNRISWYLSLGWTEMSQFHNMWHDKTADDIPPTNIKLTPIVTMTGISFAIYGYEGEGFGNGVHDIYISPARLSIGTGFGNFRWDSNDNFVSGVVAVISLEWYLFLLNF